MKPCITFVVFLFFISCSFQESSLSTFEALNTRVNDVPDSVLLILEDMDTLQMSDNDKAACWLLMAKAADKSGKSLPEISHLEDAEKYFSQQNHIVNQATCYFYIGRIWYEQGKKDTALQKYIRASELLSLSGSNKEYQLAGLINIHIGDIHFEHDQYNEALVYEEKALFNFQQISDSLNIALSLRNIGRCYLFKRNPDSAICPYRRALLYARSSCFQPERSAIFKELSVAYRLKGNYGEALNYIRQSIETSKNMEDLISSYLTMGKIYAAMQRGEEAKDFFELSSRSTNIYTKIASNKALFEYYRNMENYREALRCNDSILKYKEIAQSIQRNEAVYEIQQKYENEKLKKITFKQQLDNQQLIISMILIVLISVGLIVIGWFLHRRFRQRKEIELQSIRHKIRRNLEHIAQLESQKKHYQERLTEYEQKLNKKQAKKMKRYSLFVIISQN